MTKQDIIHPHYIFEVSWEVCNRVGGIYAVLSTRAKSMVDSYGQNNVIFIGPDIWTEETSPWFIENDELLPEWQKFAKENFDLDVRVGHWDVPGNPLVILVKYNNLFAQKNDIYARMWERFGVESINAYGDYDESCMFAYASGKTIESFYSYFNLSKKRVVAHFNEWTVGMGALYIKDKLPQVATLFTTHATTVGRSIAGNNKALYSHLNAYNGDQMAQELNVEAKHSIEKCAAQQVDCFTTVSNITGTECAQFLERSPFITPNGFEQDFVPIGRKFETKRKEARKALINVANKLYGLDISDDALLIATSGRYEYRNKGIDVFVDSLDRLNRRNDLNKEVIAFVMVPAWVREARIDLIERIKSDSKDNQPLPSPSLTHWINEVDKDPVLNQAGYLGLNNYQNKVKLIFVPSYLNGDDGIFNLSYYDLLIGLDITVFPSYYEPWGYTPHESIAFSVPTITTYLAGFGSWIAGMGNNSGMEDAVEVIHRDDYNFVYISERICEMIVQFSLMTKGEQKAIKKLASEKSKLGNWDHFFRYYKDAYTMALEVKNIRTKKK